MVESKAELGIFGGSGFYTFLDTVEEVYIETPYGAPSDRIAVGEIEGHKIAFLARHGNHHQHPPHTINYRANLFALKELGVKRILGPCAAGSLQPHIKPGDFVICDQFVDRTNGRQDTFYNGPVATHVAGADPYCPDLRKTAFETADKLGISVHPNGTVVVIQGPRFSTRAESRWFSGQGWEVINMTQYPEAYLARELEMCYVNISLITDYDIGVGQDPGVQPVTHEEVIRVFNENNARLRELLFRMIPKIPEARPCLCSSALEGARF